MSDSSTSAATIESGLASQQQPLLSVLMPCYNTRVSYLSQAIESILAQTFKNFEFLIIDDGSTDVKVKETLKSYVERDSRIRIVTHPRNLGLIASLNHGLLECQTSLIARMDSDDISLPERLEKQYAFMLAHPMVAVVGTGVEIFSSREEDEAEDTKKATATTAGDVSSSSSASSLTVLAAALAAPSSSSSTASSSSPASSSRTIIHPLTVSLLSWSLPFYCPLAHPSVMYRATSLPHVQIPTAASPSSVDTSGEVGPYSAGWKYCEDYELWCRMEREGIQMRNLPDVLLRLRKHTSNISSSSSRSSLLQQHHSLLAVQHHVTSILSAPVALEYIRGLRTPSSINTVGDLHTVCQLLRALESHALQSDSGLAMTDEERQAIKKDCTARIGELVTLAMKIESGGSATSAVATATSTTSSQPQLTLDLPSPASAILRSFTGPIAPVTSSGLMSIWMSRGADASAMLGMLLRKK